MSNSAARVSTGSTERGAQCERVSVVRVDVVHGVLAVIGVVVASQQTIDLRVDEKIVVQSADPGFRHAGRSLTRRTTDDPLASAASVGFQAWHTERVPALQYLRANPESVAAQPTRQELFGDRFWLVFTAVVLLKNV